MGSGRLEHTWVLHATNCDQKSNGPRYHTACSSQCAYAVCVDVVWVGMVWFGGVCDALVDLVVFSLVDHMMYEIVAWYGRSTYGQRFSILFRICCSHVVIAFVAWGCGMIL
jgi:hypothetical protein